MTYNKEYYLKNRDKLLNYQKEWQKKYRKRLNLPKRNIALKAWKTRRINETKNMER